MQFTYFDLEMAEKEKVARQVLYGPATTKIQHRTGSENSDWTINRFSFWPCICCKCCCASFTVLLKHVKAEQKEEDENNWRKNKRNMQMRVNLYWWSRREGRNVAEWERIVVGANYFFFFLLKKCDWRTEFYMQLFSWRLCQQNFCQSMSLP